ncbi:MAG: right-handed parallel beta-helix repeat-containing protein [Candidatus Odinarchaeota archaeon]
MEIRALSNYLDVHGVLFDENTFKNSSGTGIEITGTDITIRHNSFINLSYGGLLAGRNFLVESNIFCRLDTGITTPLSLSSPDPDQWALASISNITVQYNNFSHIQSFGIKLVNLDQATVFYFLKNNFSDIFNPNGAALAFNGSVGGESSDKRSWVIGNIINNSAGYGIIGQSYIYFAWFRHTSFFKNAFINCSRGEVLLENSLFYSLTDVKWDNDFFGNYWESYIGVAEDEDLNLIGDNFYTVSPAHGQVDQAPLLCFDFLYEKSGEIGSTHPTDKYRTQSELNKKGMTLSWTILGNEEQSKNEISVWFNGQQIGFNAVNTSIVVSLNLVSTLDAGSYNLSLRILSSSFTYRDLIWIHILPNDQTARLSTENIITALGIAILIVNTGLAISTKIHRALK